jgi:GNAT superfamily N-acetyltransferase
LPKPKGAIREITIEDAKAYAQMVVRSEKGWPWSWGSTFTTMMAREEIEGSAAVGFYVAEDDGKIVGTTCLFKGLMDRDSGYIGYTNVEPDYQGKKYGKRLLRRAIDKAIEDGIDRVDLHTWAGNLKALPLYKKMGFHWVPETHVEMKNFIPMILKHELCRDFFRDNPDWYGNQVRDLSPREDLFERDGIRIYEYRFEADGTEVTAIADREGLWITGGSNRDIDVWIHPENEVCPEAFPQSMFWEITNRTDREMTGTLIVTAPDCIQILDPPPRSVKIPPGRSAKLQGSFRIDPRSERKDSWEQPDRVISNMIVGGKMYRFQTGVGREGALDFTYDPRYMMVSHGARTKLNVRLRNRTKLNLRGKVVITPLVEDLAVEKRVHEFELDPEGYAGFTTDVECSESAPTGYTPIALQPIFPTDDGKEIKTKEEVLHGSCVRPGEMLDFTTRDGRVLHIDTDRLDLSIDLRQGGRVTVRDRLSEEMLLGGFGEDALGPPFWPSEFERCRCTYAVDRGEGFIRATIFMKSELHEGLTLFKTFTLRKGWPAISVQYGLINSFPSPRSFKLNFGAHSLLNRIQVYLPMKQGIVSDKKILTGFPQWKDTPQKPGEYPENWIAIEGYKDRLFTVGLIWPRDLEEVEFEGSSLGSFKMAVKVPANGRMSTPPVHLCAGDGTWEGVREVWRKLEGRSVGREKRQLRPRIRRSIEFGFPDPILVRGTGPYRCNLRVSSTRMTAEKAWLSIAAPSGWSAQPARLSFRKLGARDVEKELLLTPPGGVKPGIYEGEILLRTEEHRWRRSFPVLHLGDGRVDVEEIDDRGMKAYLVTNGTLEFKVSAAFGGTVHSLVSNGVELLASSFPESRPMLEFNPWYGGLSGYVGRSCSKGWRESYEATPVKRGFWEGVETACHPGDHAKEIRGLVVRTRYMLARSSNIIRVEQEISNPMAAKMEVHTGLNLFVGMGEEADIDSVVPDEEDRAYVRPRTDRMKRCSSQTGWVGLRNSRVDSGMVLAGPVSDRAFVWAQESRGLTILESSVLQELVAGRSSEWAWHVACCTSDIDDIYQHRHMRDLSPQSEPLYET